MFRTRSLLIALILTTAFALLALVVNAGLTDRAEDAPVQAALAARSSAITGPVQLVTFITSAAPALALCAVWSLIAYRRSRDALASAWPLLAYFGHLSCNIALRVAIGRWPPDVDHIPNLLPEFQASFQQFAFPSGHAGAALIAYGALALLARDLGRYQRPTLVLAAIIILGTGLGRVYLGVHWPSDVLGGWLLAGAWLSVARAWRRYNSSARRSPVADR